MKRATLLSLYVHPGFCTIQQSILYLLFTLKEKFCGRRDVFRGIFCGGCFHFTPWARRDRQSTAKVNAGKLKSDNGKILKKTPHNPSLFPYMMHLLVPQGMMAQINKRE